MLNHEHTYIHVGQDIGCLLRHHLDTQYVFARHVCHILCTYTYYHNVSDIHVYVHCSFVYYLLCMYDIARASHAPNNIVELFQPNPVQQINYVENVLYVTYVYLHETYSVPVPPVFCVCTMASIFQNGNRIS